MGEEISSSYSDMLPKLHSDSNCKHASSHNGWVDDVDNFFIAVLAGKVHL